MVCLKSTPEKNKILLDFNLVPLRKTQEDGSNVALRYGKWNIFALQEFILLHTLA